VREARALPDFAEVEFGAVGEHGERHFGFWKDEIAHLHPADSTAALDNADRGGAAFQRCLERPLAQREVAEFGLAVPQFGHRFGRQQLACGEVNVKPQQIAHRGRKPTGGAIAG